MNNFKYPKLYDQKGDLDKRWFVGYYFKHPETNKFKLFHIWISSSIHTKLARYTEAKKIIEIYKVKLQNGFNPFNDHQTKAKSIIESINFILELKKNTTKTRTYQSYKSTLKSFIQWLELNKLDHLPGDFINKIHAQSYMDYLISHSRISGRTYNNSLVYLKTLFNELLTREVILKNPFLSIKRIPQNEPPINSYTKEELSTLKQSIEKNYPFLWLFCQFVFYCGIRPAELVRIKLNDLNIEQGKLTIQSYNSKNRKTQNIYIPLPLLENLVKLNVNEYPKDFYLFSAKLKPGIKQVVPIRYSEAFRNILDEIGMPKSKKLYDLKHTGVGMVIENGANINDLKIHLRHHDLSITDKYAKRFKSNVSKDFLDKYPIID